MVKKIEKYDDFKSPENTDGKSTDIIALAKLEDGSYEKIDEPINILQITGMITDEEDIKKIEEGFTLDTSLRIVDAKVGQKLWLTCILEKSGSHGINSQSMGVVECRIVNTYKGLSKLSQIK